MGEGALEQCYTITLLHMNRLSKTESAIFVSLSRSLLSGHFHKNLFDYIVLNTYAIIYVI